MKILPGERCHVPDEHLYKFETDRLGCSVVSFSPNGRYLAAAVTKENSRTMIHNFDVEDGELKVILPGHNNIVHEISWNLDSDHLLTSSSDMSSKVTSSLNQIWKIPLNPNIEKSSEEVYKETFIQNIFHPSYVYTGKLIPERFNEFRFVAITGCFDGKVRVFNVSLDHGMVHPAGRPR